VRLLSKECSRIWATSRPLVLPTVAGVCALAVPLTNDPYYLSVALNIAIWAVLAIGMNIVVGYAGLLDLGYSAFMAIGAYVTAILMLQTSTSFWLTWPLSGLVAGVFGVVIGLPTLRLRTDYLAIVTLGFGEITRLVITNLEFTGGPSGLYGVPSPSLFGHQLESMDSYYFLALAMLVAGIGFTIFVRRSRLGAAWLYVRYDADVAQAVGVNPLTTKLAAYGFGAVWGGLAGALFVVSATAVSPSSFMFAQSLLVLMAVILGGQGSLFGAMLGAAAVVGLPELFRPVASWRLLAFGVVLILLMIRRPQGLIRMRPTLPLERRTQRSLVEVALREPSQDS
jgi:branched-chain amino acid transport system permease protein